MKADDEFRRTSLVTAAIASAVLAIAACDELPQDAPKPFTATDETRSYEGGPFKGDKGLYEKTLAERAKTQDEYLIMGGAKK